MSLSTLCPCVSLTQHVLVISCYPFPTCRLCEQVKTQKARHWCRDRGFCDDRGLVFADTFCMFCTNLCQEIESVE